MRAKHLVVLICLFLTPPCLAWWGEGHAVVAKIAWAELKTQDRERISKVLSYHPDPAVTSIAWASVWPDLIKEKTHSLHHLDRPEWHYQNRPVCHGQEGRADSGKLLIALEQQLKIFRDISQTKADRAMALSWVVHLVGDIHQPLHNATLFTPELKLGDQGGNKSWVLLGNRELSLHKLWDSAGGRFLGPISSNRLRNYSLYFAKKYGPEFRNPELLKTDFQAWSDEGLTICEEQIYPGFVNGRRLDSQTQETALDVSARQMTLAGFRLAELLRSSSPLLKPDPSSP